MTLIQKLRAAGFKTKADFADHIGKHAVTVRRWGDDPPQWAQAVLLAWMTRPAAVWVTFDADDKETWPKTVFAPSGSYWLCQVEGGCGDFSSAQWLIDWWDEDFIAGWETVIRYCDPIDIVPDDGDET